MPTPTYIPLATKTLTATATSVTFSSISQAYRDLVLVFSGTANANTYFNVTFNGSSTGYNWVHMTGEGNAPVSAAVTGHYYLQVGSVTTSTATNIVNIMDYAATDKHKTTLSSSGRPADVARFAGRWADTSAINSVVLSTLSGSFSIGSSFTLYGIASA